MVLKSIKDMVPVLNMISKHVDNHLNNDERLNLSFISNQMKKLCDELGMRFYVSDAHFKESCNNSCCCALPEDWEYSRGNF